MIKLSIIVPVYNAGNYLNYFIDSVISQKGTDYELILVNDGSSDNSLEICNEYKRKDSRIEVISTNNVGSGYARNAGIKIARGEYLLFLDSDDLMEENSIEAIREELKKDTCDMYVFSYTQLYRDKTNAREIIFKDKLLSGKKIRKNYQKHLVFSDEYLQGAPWNKVFKKEIIEKNNLLYTNLKRHQDEAFIIMYIDKVEKIKLCSKKIYIYYLNKGQDESLKFPRNYFEIRTELYSIFLNIMTNWNGNNLAILHVKFNYLLALRRCFELMFSKKWNMTCHERKKYVEELLNNQYVISCLNDLDMNKKEYELFLKNINYNKVKIWYYRFYLKLIKSKSSFLISMYSFLILMFKRIKDV